MDAVNLSEKYIFLDLRSWEINIARTARRLGAVSYTQLDVYKRQH